MAATSLTPEKTVLVEKIRRRFEDLYEAYGEPTPNLFKETKQSSLNVDIQNNLFVHGIHFTSFKKDSDRYVKAYNDNLSAIVKVMHLFIYETEEQTAESELAYNTVEKSLKTLNFTPLELQFAGLCSKWNSKAGFGNSSFRFLYGQFVEKGMSPTFKIADEDVEFTYNPFHNVNLELLASLPEVFTSLKEIYTTSNPMISHDSQKARMYHSSFKEATAPTLTARHRDIYAKEDGTELDRKQAMIIFERLNPKVNPIWLGYVLFSNDEKIRKYLELYFKKEYNKFSTVEDPYLNPIFDKWWRSLRNGLVVWDQATIHYEGVPEVCPHNPLLYRLVTDSNGVPVPEATISKGPLHNSHLAEPNFRAVIGTHTPYNLSQKDLTTLASLAIQGWCPEIYTKNRPNNKKTKVDGNVVNHKTTQYAVPRKLKAMEKRKPEVDEDLVMQLPKIYREFYGIYDDELYQLSQKTQLSVYFLETTIRDISETENIPYAELLERIKAKYA